MIFVIAGPRLVLAAQKHEVALPDFRVVVLDDFSSHAKLLDLDQEPVQGVASPGAEKYGR